MSISRDRSRYWFGTIWLFEDKEYVKSLPSNYCLISDDDHTQDEQLHWHCLLSFKNPRERPATKTAHWEKPVNIVESRNYCLEKGLNYYEKGILEIRKQNKDEWNAFVDMCKKAGPMEMIEGPFSRLYAEYRSFAGEVNNLYANLQPMDGDLENLWLTGRAGTGKTQYVWKNFGDDLYVKDLNKWWDGYHGQKYVLLDDWDPRQEVLTQKLKVWSDRYPFRAETKGSSMMARPQKIIVTSNYTIDECFQNESDIQAIKRRFKVMRFLKLGEGPTLD